ncbi:unnamed protein product [Arabis nemorensis]|uniref:Pectinesterase inhibitor domain-containing protein n=1 Tax=Arabis nemorensis TaxID=586526 RepID=A0A565C3G7_9BRAS|nr:unnamed protein product [Arabis nemorensis]
MTSLKGIVDNIIKSKSYDKGSEIPLQDCLELYSDGTDSLNEALMNVKSRDYGSAKVNLGAALDAPDTCETGFKEGKQLKSPLTNDNNVLFQKILIPLAFTNML